ncbi:hypothetical protein EMPS_00183 [Entomortierella parvispora]|uniref:Chromosome segregation in meiosis protein n=1 Tax=Entomortierella parvispora TaxID=205924 RepID=A0A9P3LRM3_9FUNG|nr:hypothetical protein EMPS_00183 [Entomortierella parvispora]
MDNIPLEDEPFERFDDYEDYEDQMMREAEAHEMQQAVAASTSGSAATGAASNPGARTSSWMGSSSRADDLPAQLDFIGMLNQQQREHEQAVQAQAQQRQQQQQQQQQQAAKSGQWQRKGGAGGSRSNGAAGGDTGGLGDLDIKKVKERVKIVKLDAEKLLGPRGFPALLTQGKGLKIRQKYSNTAEKNANVKANMTDLMRVYQTWAHNLFPKATFGDFITQAESKCKNDKQIRSTFNGWRDAYWEQKKEEKERAEEEQRKAQEMEDGTMQEAIWNSLGSSHDGERIQTEAGGSNDFRGNSSSSPFGDASSATRQISNKESGSGSESARPLLTQEQLRSRVSKEKTKAARAPKVIPGYSVSAAMRMDMSDEEAEDEAEFERRMARIRADMNQGPSKSNLEAVRRRSFPAHTSTKDEEMAAKADTVTGKNEIDLDNYDSEVEEEEEEEHEEDAPLFTNRALRLMNRDADPVVSTATAVAATLDAGVADTKDTAMMVVAADGKIQAQDNNMDSTDFSARSSQLRQRLLVDDEDDEQQEQLSTQTRRKPGRRAILLDDSDDE